MELPPLVFETSLYTIPALSLSLTLYSIQYPHSAIGGSKFKLHLLIFGG